MLKFNENKLDNDLDEMPVWAKVSFALSAASRLFNAFKLDQEESSEKVAEIIESAWNTILASRERVENLDAYVAYVKDNLKSINKTGEFSLYAENYFAAILYVMSIFKTNSYKDAIWAAGRVLDSIDNFIIENEDVDMKKSGSRAKIKEHFLMQQELKRQIRDLKDLAGGLDDKRKVVLVLKERSAQESVLA